MIRLPIDPSVAATPPTPPKRAVAFSLRVALIDDNDDIREMSKALLETLGCEVHVSGDGPSGLATIVDQHPDLALVDIGLPGLDGYGVARQAREAVGPGVFLVAVTGYGQPEDRRNALAAGFDQHITKPITLQTLRDVLQRATTQREALSASAT